MTSQLTPQEALIYVMVTVAAADRQITEVELRRIGSMVNELPAFREIDGDWLMREAQDCGRALAKPDGVRRVLALIGEALPDQLRETAYALAAEVAASDLTVKDEEMDLLEMLADELALDELVCAALERGARARHRTV
jgi:tellurite resistance protein